MVKEGPIGIFPVSRCPSSRPGFQFINNTLISPRYVFIILLRALLQHTNLFCAVYMNTFVSAVCGIVMSYLFVTDYILQGKIGVILEVLVENRLRRSHTKCTDYMPQVFGQVV